VQEMVTVWERSHAKYVAQAGEVRD
jgi:hypothetical protein